MSIQSLIRRHGVVVNIKKITGTPKDATGHPAPTWGNRHAGVRMLLMQKSGREVVRYGMETPMADHDGFLDYKVVGSDMPITTDRVEYGSRAFNIISVDNAVQMGRLVHLELLEKV